jgi:hypothetical protein
MTKVFAMAACKTNQQLALNLIERLSRPPNWSPRCGQGKNPRSRLLDSRGIALKQSRKE